MSLKRTTVYAEAEDLAIIKEAAAREGIAEAEIIREAIHLAALAKRSWSEPLGWPSFAGGSADSGEQAEALLKETWDEKARAYQATKKPRP